MRLATAAGEILPLKDPRVKNQATRRHPALQVVTRLGGVDPVTPAVIEDSSRPTWSTCSTYEISQVD
jgi:hypothetical protein